MRKSENSQRKAHKKAGFFAYINEYNNLVKCI